MKIYPILLLFLLTADILHAQNGTEAPPQPSAGRARQNNASAAIATLQKPYHAALAGIAAENLKWLAGVETWYLANLEKMQGDDTKTGDLDSAVAVREERERIAAHGATSAEQMSAMPAPVRALRGTYDASLKKIADDVDRRKMQKGQKYQAELEALQKRITMSGDLDQVLVVKAEQERIATEIEAGAHPPVTAPATPAPPIAATNPPKEEATTPKASDPAEALIGTWRFTYNGHWSGTRTFSKDGTFVGEGFSGIAKWAIVGKKVVLHYSTRDKTEEEMDLPLDPTGTKLIHRGSVVTAVKE